VVSALSRTRHLRDIFLVVFDEGNIIVDAEALTFQTALVAL